MKNVNQATLGIQPYQPGKPIEELARERGITNAIKLASNENPRGPSKRVLHAISHAGRELPRYPDGTAYRLKAVLSKRLGIEPGQITVGNGSNDVLELAGRVALSPNDKGIVDEHCFVVYPLTIQSSNAVLVSVPSIDWGHDLDGMAAAVDEHTRIVYLANPNNPTGTLFRETAFRRFMATVPKSVWVVLDEAYFEYAVDQDGYPDGVSLVREYENLIVTRTFSKAHGLAALRVGYSVSSVEFAELMNRIRQPFNANSVALAAAETSLESDDYVRESVRMNSEGMEFIQSGLTRLGLEYIPSAGNFLSFKVGKASGQVYEAMLNRGVVVRPIANYGMPEHLRVTIGTPSENDRFLTTLEAVL